MEGPPEGESSGAGVVSAPPQAVSGTAAPDSVAPKFVRDAAVAEAVQEAAVEVVADVAREVAAPLVEPAPEPVVDSGGAERGARPVRRKAAAPADEAGHEPEKPAAAGVSQPYWCAIEGAFTDSLSGCGCAAALATVCTSHGAVVAGKSVSSAWSICAQPSPMMPRSWLCWCVHVWCWST